MKAETIAQLREGDERAFQAIYECYHRLIYHFAYSFLKNVELSKEVTQETFLSLWVNRGKLDASLPLYPYLYAKARRLTIDAFRRAASIHRLHAEWTTLLPEAHNETEQRVFHRELAAITEEALQQMPKQQQLVFRMSRSEGLSYEEIAEELHISKNTVKYHLVQSLKFLKGFFAKHGILYFFILTLFI
ncbi:RNA polymerase sigma-70 factor [Olivibacter sp. CPCC 100613]|uniref:RNA polymerase sigma factor n=1 Tax=Olivibacter sp. CPCC 100613 TaxID=3079931 RepID=UPI002FF929E5